MIKVLMISGSFPPDKCGVGDYTKLLCDKLYERSVQLNVISSYKSGNEKYLVNNSIKQWSIKNIRLLLKQIEFANPDVVHIQYPTKAYGKSILINLLPLILKVKKYKVVTTIHEYSDNSFLGKLRIIPNIIFSDHVLVVDPIYKKDIVDKLFFVEKKINFVNLASNIPKSDTTEFEKEVLRNNLLDKKNKLIGYFGFINESKNVEKILEAMGELKQYNRLKSSLLMIAELDEKNNYHKKLLNIINEKDLNEHIIITGYLREHEVSRNIAIVDYFILPFKNGFSPKNGSALAALQEGKKVVTTKSKLDLKDLDNLIYLNNDNLKRELIQVIENYQDEIFVSHGELNNMYSWEIVADKHLEIYRKILNETI